ncbi:unnamed protein product [Amoebophrya sp. A25]|nr:unnamed protein product [Amoebophrya sp. A25]|eukprot:GSA25T00016686001.1
MDKRTFVALHFWARNVRRRVLRGFLQNRNRADDDDISCSEEYGISNDASLVLESAPVASSSQSRSGDSPLGEGTGRSARVEGVSHPSSADPRIHAHIGETYTAQATDARVRIGGSLEEGGSSSSTSFVRAQTTQSGKVNATSSQVESLSSEGIRQKNTRKDSTTSGAPAGENDRDDNVQHQDDARFRELRRRKKARLWRRWWLRTERQSLLKAGVFAFQCLHALRTRQRGAAECVRRLRVSEAVKRLQAHAGAQKLLRALRCRADTFRTHRMHQQTLSLWLQGLITVKRKQILANLACQHLANVRMRQRIRKWSASVEEIKSSKAARRKAADFCCRKLFPPIFSQWGAWVVQRRRKKARQNSAHRMHVEALRKDAVCSCLNRERELMLQRRERQKEAAWENFQQLYKFFHCWKTANRGALLDVLMEKYGVHTNTLDDHLHGILDHAPTITSGVNKNVEVHNKEKEMDSLLSPSLPFPTVKRAKTSTIQKVEVLENQCTTGSLLVVHDGESDVSRDGGESLAEEPSWLRGSVSAHLLECLNYSRQQNEESSIISHAEGDLGNNGARVQQVAAMEVAASSGKKSGINVNTELPCVVPLASNTTRQAEEEQPKLVPKLPVGHGAGLPDGSPDTSRTTVPAETPPSMTTQGGSSSSASPKIGKIHDGYAGTPILSARGGRKPQNPLAFLLTDGDGRESYDSRASNMGLLRRIRDEQEAVAMNSLADEERSTYRHATTGRSGSDTLLFSDHDDDADARYSSRETIKTSKSFLLGKKQRPAPRIPQWLLQPT